MTREPRALGPFPVEIGVSSDCVGCGACVRDCPKGVLELKDGRPTVREKKHEACIDCRHCVAVCPTGAFSVNGVSASDGETLSELELPSAAAIRNLLRSRRSIRQYAAAELPRETIDGLLETLKHVPMGCNERHLVFRVVPTRARLDELRRQMVAALLEREATLPPFLKGVVAAIRKKPEMDPFFRGAPHLLIVQASPKATCPEADAIGTCAYFDLLLQGSGYGTTWCGFLSLIVRAVPELGKLFGIPDGAPFFAMLFGVPAVRYQRTVPRPDGAKVEYL